MENTVYLLTGAAGLLGNNICRTLISQQKNVRALVLPGDPTIQHIPKEAEIVMGNVLDLPSLEHFFTIPEGTDAVVIHCASIVTMSPEPSQQVYDVNVVGTQNIVDLCITHQIKKMIYVSSTGAIPELKFGQIISEPEALDAEIVTGYYSKTKALATMYVLEAVKSRGLNASVVYPSGICGPNDYALGLVSGLIRDYCCGKIDVGMQGTFNAVDARDLANGILACVEKGRPGEGYIMSNELIAMQQLFDLASDYSGTPRIKQFLPVEAIRQKMVDNLPDGPEKEKQISAFEFSTYNLTRNNHFSCEKARRELGYHTRPFAETILDEVNWLIEAGHIKKAGDPIPT